MTSISIDLWYQSIFIGRLNRLILIINRLISDIDFYWLTMSGRMWGCEAVRVRGSEAPSCEAMKLWGWQVFRLWVCILGCDVVWSYEVWRLWGGEVVRLWDYETMRLWDYDMRLWDYMILLRLWGFESLVGRGGVAFSLIPSFTFPSFKNSQITLDNIARSEIGRDLTSYRERGVEVKGKMFMSRKRTGVK